MTDSKRCGECGRRIATTGECWNVSFQAARDGEVADTCGRDLPSYWADDSIPDCDRAKMSWLSERLASAGRVIAEYQRWESAVQELRPDALSSTLEEYERVSSVPEAPEPAKTDGDPYAAIRRDFAIAWNNTHPDTAAGRAISRISNIITVPSDFTDEPEPAKASGWVLCSERLPPTGLNVIVDGGCAFFDGQDWRTSMGHSWGNVIQWPVTHWMPLPAPPDSEAK
jgi:hypothetical protein